MTNQEYMTIVNKVAFEADKAKPKMEPYKDDYNMGVYVGLLKAVSILRANYNSVKTELEDCISRAEAIKETKALFLRNFDSEYVVEMLKTLPSVTPKTRWIPCSERLPKENEYIGNVCKYYLIQDEYGDMHVAHLSKVGWIPMDSLKAIGDEVIAWRELPQPYKEVQNDRISKDME